MNKTPLQKIQESALKILAPLDSKKLFRICIQEALSISGAKYGSLFLSKNERLVRVFSTVPRASRFNPRPNGETYKAFQTGRTRVISRARLLSNHPQAIQSPRAIVVIPMSYLSKRIGVMTLHFYNDISLTVEEKQILRLFGSLASLAIRNMELYERSRAALTARETFMSMAAHEFKTPLAVIQAYAQIAEKKLKQNKPIQPKWIEAIISNGTRLQNLVQELFSTSQLRMGSFTYQFTTVNLSQLVEKNVTELALLHRRQITLKNSIKPGKESLEADPEKLAQVLSNLIGNAVKFSSQTTPIVVALKRTNENFLLTVEDRGKGIAPQDLDHIFDQYFQGGEQRAAGMGLGMYLCKQIVQAHQGEIRVTSHVGVGTKVFVRLPLPSYARI